MQRAWIAAITVLSACSFSPSASSVDATLDGGELDATLIPDAVVPDAAIQGCQQVETTCAGNVLRVCGTVGQQPVDTVCDWGCVTEDAPHCGRLVPSGGAVTPEDLDPDGALAEITIVRGRTWNTDTGEIQNLRGAGTGVINGIDFKVVDRVGVFRFKRLTIDTDRFGDRISVRGGNALAIVSTTTVRIDGVVIDVRGDCAGANPGPGGFAGGAADDDGAGAPGQIGGRQGAGNTGSSSGGGGGGHGDSGGGGGRAGATGARPGAGPAFGDATITTLAGGAGGGGGGGTGGGVGGGGGGAIQIAANQRIDFDGEFIAFFGARQGGINAGGCRGKPGGTDFGGGGGGAGGAILLEAAAISFDGPDFFALEGAAVNGGGGGAGGATVAAEDGLFLTDRAQGGNGDLAGHGGDGGARFGLRGADGGDDTQDPGRTGGGGGGGVGRVRFNTLGGQISIDNSFLSPSPAQAIAEIQ